MQCAWIIWKLPLSSLSKNCLLWNQSPVLKRLGASAEELCAFLGPLLPTGSVQLGFRLLQPLLSPKYIELCWRQSIFLAILDPQGDGYSGGGPGSGVRLWTPLPAPLPQSSRELPPGRQLPPHKPNGQACFKSVFSRVWLFVTLWSIAC